MSESCCYGCGCDAAPAPAPLPTMAFGCGGSGMKYGGGTFRPRTGIMAAYKPTTKKDKAKRRKRRSVKKSTRKHAKRSH